MKNLLTIIFLLMMVITPSMADNNFGGFDPEKYNRDLEAAMTREAHLTQQEAQAFFPLFREMQTKLHALFDKSREYQRSHPTNEKEALATIKGMDATDLAIKKVQQQYHVRFLKVLSASKVFACIKAEEHFNRNMMRNMAKQSQNRPRPQFQPKK